MNSDAMEAVEDSLLASFGVRKGEGSGPAKRFNVAASSNLLEEEYVLSSPRVGLSLCTFAVVGLLTVQALFVWTLGEDSLMELGPVESQAVLLVLVVQIFGLLQQTARRQLDGNRWTSRVIFTVKACACYTNLYLYLWPTPWVIDRVTGRPNCMFRWAEFMVMVCVMAFLVEGTDATDLRQPLMFAACQCVSTAMGALVVFVRTPLAWGLLMLLSCVLFGTLYVRIYERAIELKHLEVTTENIAVSMVTNARQSKPTPGSVWLGSHPHGDDTRGGRGATRLRDKRLDTVSIRKQLFDSVPPINTSLLRRQPHSSTLRRDGVDFRCAPLWAFC